jgi:hypothetical protein
MGRREETRHPMPVYCASIMQSRDAGLAKITGLLSVDAVSSKPGTVS